MRPLRHAFLTLCAGAPLVAQPVRTLGKPDVEFAEPFTRVSGMRELKDGRVVVIDPRDKTIQVLDFKTGTAKRVGREGSGPREYGFPMSLHALPGDTSAVFDPFNSRFLLVTPGGEPGEFMRLPQPTTSSGSGGMMTVSMTPPRYVDNRGRFYMLGSGVRMVNGEPQTADSLPILRIDRASQKTDTLGYVKQPKENVQTTGDGNRMQVRMGVSNPFATRDEWVVTADGRVGILRAAEYRLDWVAPTRATGVANAYTKLKVSEAHKQQWRDSQRGATALMITNTNGRTTTQAGPAGAGGIRIPEPTDWPELMPPFLGTGQSVLAAPNGQVWVARTREAKDEVPTYDVLDAAGRVAMRVALAPKTRVAGFGNGVVYTIRTDEDDLQYLQRHRMP
ncbi:MAG: hypothetical protein IPK85_13430 [Gemmatimonadetes bacterium]|nr:hypothetical protein [Gemmatimonadota bacterium]